jgi:hypothetical protein
VRIIVAVGAGGGDDFVARQLAAKLGEVLGQQQLLYLPMFGLMAVFDSLAAIRTARFSCCWDSCCGHR